MKKIYQAIISFVTVAICVVYVYYHRGQLQMLKNLQVQDVVILMLLLFSFFCATGYTFKLILRLLKIELKATETIGLSVLTNFGNYLGPISPGSVIKAMYLKSTKQLNYTKFVSVFAANNFLAIFMTGFLGSILYFLIKVQFPQTPLFFLLINLGLIVGALIPFLFPAPKFKKEGRVSQLWHSVVDGFNCIRHSKKELVVICFSYILQFICVAIAFKLTFKFLNVPISFLLSMVIAVYTAVITYFPVTPSNLGVQEAVAAYVFTLSGLDFATGMVGAGLFRVIHFIVVFAFTPVCVHILFTKQNLELKKLMVESK